MTASIALKLDGPMDHLRLAWQAAETLLSEVPFEAGEEDAKGVRYNVLLAIQELVTNVIRHGYGEDNPEVLIEVQLEASAEGFHFELRDRARPFDPTTDELDPRRQNAPEGIPEEEGGYGLVIVKAILDQMDYRRRDGWNVLGGTKHVHAPVPVGEDSR